MAVLVVAASALGLLCTRVGAYDDGLLLVGARVVGAGRLPYRDFYTHYGPLGYFLLEPPMRWIRNPGIALRVAQASALAAVLVLLLSALRRSAVSAGPMLFGFAALLFSAALSYPAFLGFAFAASALAAAVACRASSGTRGRAWLLAAAALLAAAFWTRAAFAAYAAGALVFLELLHPDADARRRLSLGVLAAAFAGGALWLAFFPALGARTIAEGMLLAPARLVTLGPRFRIPGFVTAGLPWSALIGGAIAAAPFLWTVALTGRRVRRIAAGAILLGAALPVALTPATKWIGALLTVTNLALALLIGVLSRDEIRRTPSLWAAAAFGLAASAFGHYYWIRPDFTHLYPLLSLSAAAVLFTASSPIRTLAAALVLALPLVPLGADDPEIPLFRLAQGGLARAVENAARPGARLATLWPAGEFSSDAAEAVSLADRLSDRGSRFVAYGSEQSWTPGDPVFLFLLSSRLPYTRWFQYDPGVQSSPPIQQEMIREIEASGSRAAVVWRSESYYFDAPPAALAGRSPFDAYVDRAFPSVVRSFGSYEVRTRDPEPPR